MLKFFQETGPQSQIDFETENWKLLDGQRIVKKDSFDFKIETIGVYSNEEIIKIACEVLSKKLDDLDKLIDNDNLEIKQSDTTIQNAFDIILENEDHTLGKVIEYYLYNKFYIGDNNLLSYCGFKKMHPHDTYSIIRLGYKSPITESSIKGHFKECIADAKINYKIIMKPFLNK